MTDAVMTDATKTPAEIAASLSPGARLLVRWAARNATSTEPAWLRPDQDPRPAIEARRAGCVTLDVYAVMPTDLGRAVAAVLTQGEGDRG